MLQPQFILYALLFQPHTMDIDQYHAYQSHSHQQTEPPRLAPVRVDYDGQTAHLALTLVLKDRLHLKRIFSRGQSVVGDFVSLVGHNPFLLIRVQTVQVFLQLVQVKQVGERKRKVPVGMVQMQTRGIEQGAGQNHLPVHVLANLHRCMVHLQVGEHHPSPFDGIMKAEPRGTEISQCAVISPEQEILSEENRTVAA